MKSVAVVTDATHSGAFFPIWYRYYGALFGVKNLYVLTYKGLSSEFESFALGALWGIQLDYGDNLRSQVISSWVSALLSIYDVVIRCDVDEFLVPDRRYYDDLKDFVLRFERPFVTAYGVDVIEANEDSPLDYSLPILGNQRRLTVRSTPLNKTCITRVPLQWSPGFHSATVSPIFHHIYLFHMKFADIAGRINWFSRMISMATPGSSEYTYFSNATEKLVGHRVWCNAKQKKGPESFYDKEVDYRFQATVSYNMTHKIYQGDFFTEDTTCVLPDQFFESI